MEHGLAFYDFRFIQSPLNFLLKGREFHPTICFEESPSFLKGGAGRITYWQASQSGLSIEHACGTGAA